jgi:hypothetical protein
MKQRDRLPDPPVPAPAAAPVSATESPQDSVYQKMTAVSGLDVLVMSLLIMYAMLSTVCHRVILNHCTIPYGIL